MAQTLRDFINARETEIKTQLKALDVELRELTAAKSAISADAPQVKQTRISKRTTHREMIVAVLDEHNEGGASDRVIEWIKSRFGVEIPQASMSSQLSRAKSDNLISLDSVTKIWRSAKHTSSEVASHNENPDSTESGEAKAEHAYNMPDFLNPQSSHT